MKFLNQLYQKVVAIPIKLLVKSKILPEQPIKELNIDLESPIYYVLQRRSTSSFLMLQQQALQLGLPEPKIINRVDDDIPQGGVFFLQNKQIFGFIGKPVKKYQLLLDKLLTLQKQDINRQHQLVPVSVYWGRNPGKENSLFRLLFTDTESANPIRKCFLILFQGRNSFVKISKPVNFSTALKSQIGEKNVLRKLTRTLRVHFERNRRSVMGPLISNRKNIITNIIVSDYVKSAIERETYKKNISEKKAKQLAESYAKEITSNYSYKTIRIIESILTYLWNKIYDGIEINHAEKVRELATTHEIIYVPSHRSHTDYLLLSYSLYHEGLVPPHIAAGINLNFWPVGSVLRRAGAFFLRRSFGGNKLYTAVFNEYIFQLMDRGIPLKFFPEGGRSRTGRLLPPKTGLLSMVVQGCLRGTRKPIALVPIYVGYERMFEGKSYINELKGAKKEKESFTQLLSLRKTLKEAFGKVYLNFAEPLLLNEHLNQQQPDWRQYQGKDDIKPVWLTSQVNELANQLMERINTSATLNSVSLMGLILLSTERNAIDKESLKFQLQLLIEISKKAPYSKDIDIPEEPPEQLINQAKKLGTVTSSQDTMGEIISTDSQMAALLTYYRNNIIHVFITSGLIASCFVNRTSITQAALIKEVERLFAFTKKDFFIHWDKDEYKNYIKQIIDVFIEEELLVLKAKTLVRADETHLAYHQLFIQAQLAYSSLQRYAILLTALTLQGEKKSITRQEINKFSQQITQRISELQRLKTPEIFDRNLFQNMFSTLITEKYLIVNSDNTYELSPEIIELQESVLSKLTIDAKYLIYQSASFLKD